jgi:hypothetical protein
MLKTFGPGDAQKACFSGGRTQKPDFQPVLRPCPYFGHVAQRSGNSPKFCRIFRHTGPQARHQSSCGCHEALVKTTVAGKLGCLPATLMVRKMRVAG